MTFSERCQVIVRLKPPSWRAVRRSARRRASFILRKRARRVHSGTCIRTSSMTAYVALKPNTAAQATLGDLHRVTPWVRVYGEKCPHYPHSPALSGDALGFHLLSDKLRRSARCTACRHKFSCVGRSARVHVTPSMTMFGVERGTSEAVHGTPSPSLRIGHRAVRYAA